MDDLLRKQLFVAIINGNFDMVKDLVQQKPDLINVKGYYTSIIRTGIFFDQLKYSPLYIAIKESKYDIFKFLLDNGADVNYHLSNDSPLTYAMQVRDPNTRQPIYTFFEDLVKHPNINKDRFYDLMSAVQQNDPYFIKIMMDNGFNPFKKQDTTDINLLGYAFNSDIVKLLLEYGLVPTDKEIRAHFFAVLSGKGSDKMFDILNLLIPKFLENYATSGKMLTLYDIDAGKFIVSKRLIDEDLIDFFSSNRRNPQGEKQRMENNKTKLVELLNNHVKDIKPTLSQTSVYQIISQPDKYSKKDLERLPIQSLEMIYDAISQLTDPEYVRLKEDIKQIVISRSQLQTAGSLDYYGKYLKYKSKYLTLKKI